MHQFLIVDKDHKGGRFDRHLCNIVKAEALTLVGRRLLQRYGLRHDLVEYAGSHPHRMVFNDRVDRIKKLG